MQKMWLILALSASLSFVGCATTPQQPLSFDQLGQFNQYPLNQNSYRISFQAHPKLSFATAEEITLLEAARTTLAQGFVYFKVMDDPSNRSQKAPRQTVVYDEVYPYPAFPYRRMGMWHDPIFYNPPRVVNIDPIQVSYSIICYKENQQPQDSFDARLILQSLGQKYGVSPTGQILTPSMQP